MTNNKSCTINILNKSYEIKSPKDEEANLLLAAEKLNEQIRLHKNQFKNIDDFKILLLAALEISHQLVLSENYQENQRLQVTQFISSLETKINKAVGGKENKVLETD